MYHLEEHNLMMFLFQFFILLGSAKLLGIFFNKIKQPTITADLLVGIFFGPTILGRLAPDFQTFLFPLNPIQQNMLETLGWLGILFLLLVIGLEVNFSSVWKQRKSAIKISVCDIIIPIVVSGIPIFFLPDKYMVDPNARFLFTLFVATIMTISAMTVTIRAMRDLKILKSDMGFLIVSVLSINDIIGWIIFTIVLGLFLQADPNIGIALFILFATLGFAAFNLTIGRKIVDYIMTRIKHRAEDHTAASLTFVSLLGMLFGAITTKIGIHALFGFFIAGLISGEAKDFSQKSRQVISHMVYAVFVPLFFINIGLKVDFFSNFDVLLFIFILCVGTFARFIAAWLGTIISKTARSNRVPIAIAHTPGGEMHVVVGLLALEAGLITETVFVAIVCSAVVSAILMGPWMAFALNRRKEISIMDFFTEKAVVANLEASSSHEAIRKLSAVAADWTGLEIDTIYDSVIKREEIIGTAVEKGIAIPHSRIKGLDTPLIVVARSPNGIEWDSPDGLSTHLVYMILLPAEKDKDYDNIQLQILQTLISAMIEDSKREKVLAADDEDKIYNVLEEFFQRSNIKLQNKPKAV